jgi:ankyrin repeat protein
MMQPAHTNLIVRMWFPLAAGLSLASAGIQATEIADSAEAGQWDEVRSLLADGADADAAQADGSTALLWAAYYGDAEAARALLGAGADPNVTNRLGMTALAAAAGNGYGEIVVLLLDAGADANEVLPEGDTPLMLAARSGTLAGVDALLAHGADVDAVEQFHGETALMWAAGENHPDIVAHLIDAGADIEAVSAAFEWGDLKQTGVASYLPRGGLTALLHAARQNAIEAAKVLVDRGADPNAKNAVGISVMRVALANAHWDLAKLLLDAGADPNDGAIVEAARSRAYPLTRAASNRPDETDSLDFIRQLLAAGADPHKVPETKITMQYWTIGEFRNDPALFIAVREADVDMIDLLVEYGAEPAQSTNPDGATPLMAAFGFFPHQLGGGVPSPPRDDALAIELADRMLALGSDVNTGTSEGITALHLAAGGGRNELIGYLLDHGGRLEARDSVNRTPLDVAMGVPGPKNPAAAQRNPPVFDDTAALLRDRMTAAGIQIEPYVAPPEQEAKADEAGAD